MKNSSNLWYLNHCTVDLMHTLFSNAHNYKIIPDQTTWTKLEFIADLMQRWAEGKDRPQSGSLVQLVTKGGVTELVNAD